tara:strand:- start:710 stop:1600 length:891 start_codon:yes stop_codon:yes gene_type:complete
MSSKSKISVVIASIGDRDLIPTIKSINSSSIKIDEIIISIPNDAKLDLELFKVFSNIVIHKSRYKGQVAQRIEGFKISTNNYVLQLDDDIIVERYCIELMYKFIRENDRSAVSAHFHHITSKRSIYLKNDNLSISNYYFLSDLNYFRNRFFDKIYTKIKNDETISQNGIISKSGFETYPNFEKFNTPFISGWVPGGCMMHHKDNLVLSNFFPFKGKAYCEDLFHSIALKKNNIELYYHPNAIAFLKIENIKSSFKMFVKHIKSDFIVRKTLVEQNNLSKSRMLFVYLIKYFSYFFK